MLTGCSLPKCFPASLETFENTQSPIPAEPIGRCGTQYGCDASGNPNYSFSAQEEIVINIINEAYKLTFVGSGMVGGCCNSPAMMADCDNCIKRRNTDDITKVKAYLNINIPAYLLDKPTFKFLLTNNLISKMPDLFNSNSDYIKSLTMDYRIPQEEEKNNQDNNFNYYLLIGGIGIIIIAILYFVFGNQKPTENLAVVMKYLSKLN